jgi:hypothetical protein
MEKHYTEAHIALTVSQAALFLTNPLLLYVVFLYLCNRHFEQRKRSDLFPTNDLP